MRKLRRSVARYKMEKAGITHINKEIYGKSFFANNWRKYSK